MWLSANLKVQCFLLPYLPYTNRCVKLYQVNKTKRNLYFIVSFFLLSMSLYGQQKNPITDYKYYIENENVISENKLPAHASFTSFSTFFHC